MLFRSPGNSGVQTRHFYNGLLGMDDARYLEVDMEDPSTLCAGLMGNKARILSLSNGGWKDISGNMVDLGSLLDSYRGLNTIEILPDGIETFDIEQLPKMNIVSDGGLECALGKIVGCLDDIFIYVCGNWNNNVKKNAVRGFISGNRWNVVYEKEIFTPGEGFPTWWNGIYVGVINKLNSL